MAQLTGSKLGKEYDKIYQQRKADVKEFAANTKEKVSETTDSLKQTYNGRKARKLEEKRQKEIQSKLEVKATPVYEKDSGFNDISNKAQDRFNNFKNAIFKKDSDDIQYSELIKIEINKKKKNNLYGEFQISQPELRDYN